MSDERDDAAPGSDGAGDDDATTSGRDAAEAVTPEQSDDVEPTTDDEPADQPDGTTGGADAPGGSAVPTGTPRPSGKRRPAAGARPARSSAAGSKAAAGRSTPRRAVAEAPRKGNPVARLTRFLREVAAELRKVIWPTRKQLVTYTAVVLVFVSFMVAVVSGLDIAFAKGVLWVFG